MVALCSFVQSATGTKQHFAAKSVHSPYNRSGKFRGLFPSGALLSCPARGARPTLPGMRFALILIALLSLLPAPAIAGQFVLCRYGKPASACVVDGDTFWLKGEKFRPMGYDAPESGKPLCPGPAPGSKAARARLLALLNAGGVTIERQGTDRWGRTLARVTVGGEDLAAVMIGAGLGRPYRDGEAPWCRASGPRCRPTAVSASASDRRGAGRIRCRRARRAAARAPRPG